MPRLFHEGASPSAIASTIRCLRAMGILRDNEQTVASVEKAWEAWVVFKEFYEALKRDTSESDIDDVQSL